MSITVSVIGVMLIALSILFIINPESMKKLLEYAMDTKIIYFIAVARIIAGAFLLVAASDCKYSIVIIVLGIIVLACGIMTFVIGIEKSKALIIKVKDATIMMRRVFAAVPLIVGIILVYAS